MSAELPNTQSKHSSKMKKTTRKRVFAEFVKSKTFEQRGCNNVQIPSQAPYWKCCDKTFTIAAEIHKHVAQCHRDAVDQAMNVELQKVSHNCKHRKVCNKNCDITISAHPPNKLWHSASTGDERITETRCVLSDGDEANVYSAKQHALASVQDESARIYSDLTDSDRTFPWLPSLQKCQSLNGSQKGQILLYYKYVEIEDPDEVADWQRELCQRLQLTGKIRLATEGLNGTVGGSLEATEVYIQSVMTHPIFKDMTPLDFKKSSGDSSHFPKGLKVGVHKEIVPMGVDPNALSYKQAGKHLTPSEFHKEMKHSINPETTPRDTMILDCRNFYESKIGQFKGAVTPNIRKFSYWPEYVDKNLDLFQDKRVIMYCTGGIRCERGSAYLKSKGVCKEILQLQGGVHKYLEEYPNGHFKGKLFVFDDRYAIRANDEVVADCFHCGQAWDQYQPCSSSHCHQLVLACPSCREAGQTTCCRLCRDISNRASSEGGKVREECLCTRTRERVPVEK
ncbi:thiosulfate sulfurtransferase/rhodanese-like domain-containing protein 2 [Patiria miniata]|uniref:Thiosulfate sulfurtransferase/rhodanese-like domain-containing protein 2 n=1 Tax=Patiria miniata TaxID=46514 RepID=A0A914A2Q5_PATMI|nr:thiosulfate sulfurtransferase/rhodanese-like domain-containing protein 2 [Patiria miniata]